MIEASTFVHCRLEAENAPHCCRESVFRRDWVLILGQRTPRLESQFFVPFPSALPTCL